MHRTEGKPRVREMNELEALTQRRELLLERILRMEYEIHKIDQRVAFLESRISERIDVFPSQKGLMDEVFI